MKFLGHARRSLSGKLIAIMLVTTAIALAVAGAALLFIDIKDNRAALADDLRTEASITAFAALPALSFDDQERAQRSLNALQARDSITAAALYTSDGMLFAEYVRPGHPPPPPRAPSNLALEQPHLDGSRMYMLLPVVQSGESLGVILLRAEYSAGLRVRAYLNVLGASMIIGLLAALFASSWLQRVVSRPMESMAHVARQIVEKRDYSFRADKAASST
jgi:hypothetical protein